MMTRTTIRIQESLLAELKRRALAHGRSLTSEIEHLIRLGLNDAGKRKRRIRLPVSIRKGGAMPGVDLTDTSQLIDLSEKNVAM